MDINAAYEAINKFRRRRMARFVETVNLTPDHTVLDVGGSPAIWKQCPVKPRLTFLNVYQLPDVPLELQIVGDGCRIPVADKSFDIVFSNSVIEHVGSKERQAEFARELRRVGRMMWVQTPDRAFPLELHTLVPFLHWLPRSVFTDLAPFVSPRRLFESRQDFDAAMKGLRPVGRSEMEELFPAAAIIREKFLGFPKSVVAFYI